MSKISNSVYICEVPRGPANAQIDYGVFAVDSFIKINSGNRQRKSIKSLIKVKNTALSKKKISALDKRGLNTDTILGVFIRKTLAAVIIFMQLMVHCGVKRWHSPLAS